MHAIQAKHGPFSMALVVGDFFAQESNQDTDDLLSGKKNVPVPTYFFHGAQKLPDYVNIQGDGVQEIAPNLFYLGNAGLTQIAGFRVAFCGGSNLEDGGKTFDSLDSFDTLLQDPSLALPSAAPPELGEAESLQEARNHIAAMAEYAELSAKDAFRLQNRIPVDFLLTHAWPKHVTRLSSASAPRDAGQWGNQRLLRLVEATRPRYHFAASPYHTELQIQHYAIEQDAVECGVFWEREPYENPPFAALPETTNASVTRFISLANVANSKKVRWFMALNLAPASSTPDNPTSAGITRPANLTSCPYSQLSLNGSAPPPKASQNPARYADTPAPASKRRKKQHRESNLHPVSPDQCWFCLSNPKLEKHLVVTIGEECYMALPKGQVPVSSDASTLVPGGGHVLLIPIAHVSSMYLVDDSMPALRKEMQSFLSALTACYASYGAVPVTWEVVRRSNTRAGHTQTQVVPIAEDLANGLIEAFREAIHAEDLEFESDEVAAAFQNEQTDLVSAKDREDYCLIRVNSYPMLVLLRGERFNLQFPRETLTSYLQVPERSDWKACSAMR
ncbi:hypothetical protein MYAM1_002424 [Malassezia yamatoensis]|uniref:Cwf19-like C-terminal domain-containing protein n=1 Tax=Malassezia yamatoensis TaxID=253288 RepID=A0AAJ5YSK6_9BASI|nr:hypothetical protein MYAM1_002424 [Malassezia yamatoensis]